MKSIEQRKKDVLKIEGILLTDTLDLIAEKIGEIERTLIHTSGKKSLPIKKFKELVRIAARYIDGAETIEKKDVSAFGILLENFIRRIRKYIPKEQYKNLKEFTIKHRSNFSACVFVMNILRRNKAKKSRMILIKM